MPRVGRNDARGPLARAFGVRMTLQITHGSESSLAAGFVGQIAVSAATKPAESWDPAIADPFGKGFAGVVDNFEIHNRAINAADALTEYRAVLKQLNVRPGALAMVNFDDGALVHPCRWRCSGRKWHNATLTYDAIAGKMPRTLMVWRRGPSRPALRHCPPRIGIRWSAHRGPGDSAAPRPSFGLRRRNDRFGQAGKPRLRLGRRIPGNSLGPSQRWVERRGSPARQRTAGPRRRAGFR